MYFGYMALLKAVNSLGEEISPSEVSLNRSFATKELNNVQVLIDPYQQLLIDDNEVKYVEKELDWYLDINEKPVHNPLELSHKPQAPQQTKTPVSYNIALKDLAKDLIGCVNRAGPNSNYGEMCLRLKNHIGIT